MMNKILNIRFHYTWIFVFLVVTLIVTTQFSENYPLVQRIAFGLIISLLLFIAVTVREFLINVVVFAKDAPPAKLTLFVFGGIYRGILDRTQPANLPLYYLTRFLSNLVIALILYGLYATFINTDHRILAGLTQWLTYIYFLIFLLHFIPAYPLDGGQILRLGLWKSKGDYYQATGTAAFVGWLTGLLMIFAGGLVFILTEQWISSLITVLSGWIIEVAAGYTLSLVKTHLILKGVTAQDVMTGEYLVLPGDTLIDRLLRENILVKGFRYVLVSDDNGIKGALTLGQIRKLTLKDWETTTIEDIMAPAGQIRTADPQETSDILFEDMNRLKVDHIPVLEEGNLKGVVTRSGLLNLVKIRREFTI